MSASLPRCQPIIGHTPTPWEAQDYGEHEGGVGIIGLRTNNGVPYSSPTNGLVAWATLHPTEMDANDPTRATANAALIVEAVNSHEALKARIEELEGALRLAEDVLSRAPFSNALWPNGMHPQVGIEQIRTALQPKAGS